MLREKLRTIKKIFFPQKFTLSYSARFGAFETFQAAQNMIGKSFDSYNDPDALDALLHAATNQKLELTDIVNFFFLKPIIDGKPISIADFGGGVGRHYLKASNYLDVSQSSWNVIELEQVVLQGKKIAQKNNYSNLSFYNSLTDLAQCDLFFASGSLQCIQDWKEVLSFARSSRYVCLTRLPLSSTSFVAIQNIGQKTENIIPVNIFTKDEILNELSGFKLIQEVSLGNFAILQKSGTYARGEDFFMLFEKM